MYDKINYHLLKQIKKLKKIYKEKFRFKKIKNQWIGDLASLIIFISFIPIMYYVLTTFNTNYYSYFYIYSILLSNILFMIYSYQNDMIPSILFSLNFILAFMIILIIKFFKK